MPTNNLIVNHFTAVEIGGIDAALNSLETFTLGKVINLTPEEKVSFGSINETNRLLVGKVKEYTDTQPIYTSPKMDLPEFRADFADREFLITRIARLKTMLEKLEDTKILHDADNYHAALTYYNYVKYLAGENEPGASTVYEDLKQFFPNSGGGNNPPPPPTPI